MNIIADSIHYKIFSFLLILLPLTLITGPFLPDLLLTILSIYFIILTFQLKLYSFYKNYFVLIFSIFYFYLLLRGLFSENPFESLIKYNGPIFYFRYLFFVLSLNFFLTTSPNLIKKFTLTLFGVVSFCIIDGYFQWIFGFNLFGIRSPSIRVTGIFGSEEILGHFLSHVTPLLISLLIFVYGNNDKKIYFLIIFLMIAEILIFLSNDRAGFLKIFQFSILFIILGDKLKVIRFIFFILTIIILVILVVLAPDSTTRFSHTISDVTSTTIPFMPWAPSHETHFIIAIDMFLNNPIFGQGPQLFKTLCQIIPEYLSGCTSHPHNYYIQTIGELGLLGLCFILLSFTYTSWVLLKHFFAITAI